MAITLRVGSASASDTKRRGLNGQILLQRWREPLNQHRATAAVIGLSVGFWLCHSYPLDGPSLYFKWKNYSNHPQWEQDAANRDLPLGQVVKGLALTTFEGQPLSLPQQGMPTLLMFTGNCSACAARDSMARIEVLAKRFPKIHFYTVIMTGDREAARSLWQSSHFTVPLVLDKDGDAAVKVNSIFNFRQYLFDAKGRLRYRTPQEEVTKSDAARLEVALTQMQEGK